MEKVHISVLSIKGRIGVLPILETAALLEKYSQCDHYLLFTGEPSFPAANLPEIMLQVLAPKSRHNGCRGDRIWKLWAATLFVMVKKGPSRQNSKCCSHKERKRQRAGGWRALVYRHIPGLYPVLEKNAFDLIHSVFYAFYTFHTAHSPHTKLSGSCVSAQTNAPVQSYQQF